jgi:hypothetical protein
MLDPRTKKRIVVVFAYLLLFSAVIFVIHFFVASPATCTDKKQNQSERGIDCGGPCSPCNDLSNIQSIIVKKQAVANGGNNTYDAIFQINNPNDTFGAKSFKYTATLKDSEGKIIATREGSSYILPTDTRYVTELGISTDDNAVPASIGFVISDPQWSALEDVDKPQLNVYGKKFGPLPVGVGNEADGIIRNDSPYDLKEVTIVVVLKDGDGNIVGVNQTQADSVRTKEEREFRLSWPYSLGADVSSMDVDPQTDVFDPQNFSTSTSVINR